MAIRKFYLVLGLSLGLLPFRLIAQTQSSFPVSLPEKEGVSSAGINEFLDATTESKTEFHSLMLLRHGHLIAQGWWNPYGAKLKHTMYSCSKSFTATAIGFAIHEKKLALNDKVVSFFPKDLPDTISPFLASLTVRDVLSMSDGQEPDPTFSTVSRDSNWVRSFLATNIKYQPGTRFLYNSLGTYMLAAIVQKVTGKKVIDYLRPRLFQPLGITDIDWEEDLKGINTGGWGLRITTEGMAKFGQLFLQKGKWKGKQILPPGWVEEASTMKIMQDPDAPQSKKDSSDWLQGYCYQMWRCRNGAYRGDGAFGQFIIIFPQQDAVLAITAETADMQEEINLVWKYLLPAFHEGSLAPDPAQSSRLALRLKKLALPQYKKSSSTLAASLAGKTFALEPNDKNWQSLRITFKDDLCHLALKSLSKKYELDFAPTQWHRFITDKAGPSLLAAAKENTRLINHFQVAAAYHWTDPSTLELTLRYIESPHTEKIICHFNGKELTVDMQNSFDFGKKTQTLKGSSN